MGAILQAKGGVRRLAQVLRRGTFLYGFDCTSLRIRDTLWIVQRKSRIFEAGI